MFEILVKHFHGLIIFKTAVECGSINRAASTLKMTQPAVTRNIARLEDLLGFRLLERRASGVVPTDFGKTILNHVETAAHEIEQGSQSLGLLHRMRRNAVACGGSMVNMTMVAAAAERFSRSGLQRPLRMIDGATPAMLELLLAGELDFVVGSHINEAIDEHLVAETLLDEQLGVFAAHDHPLRRQNGLKIADLLTASRWIMPDSGTHLYSYVTDVLVEKGLELPQQLIESRSIAAIRWTVRNTDRLSFGTSLLHLPELISGEVRPLETDWEFPVTKHTLYRRPRHLMSRAALDLIKEIKIEARSISSQIHDAIGQQAAMSI